MVQRMARTRNETLNRGVLVFAFNTDKWDYVSMAAYCAKRVQHFLDLPTSIITDKKLDSKLEECFDQVIITEADDSNVKDHEVWKNKGRYQAYDLSPYDETILLDVDYVVNSDKLLKTFELSDTFCCHNRTQFLMNEEAGQEMLSSYSFNSLWATVVMFKKSERAKQIFDTLRMVQENYKHYANLHSFVAGTYRNDYALTLAVKIVNGHLDDPTDFIPWNLVHVGKNTGVYADFIDQQIPDAPPGTLLYNTEFTVIYDNWKRGKIRKEYIKLKDMDFHVINKEHYVNIMENK